MNTIARVININSREANAGPNGNWYFGPERGIVRPENMVYIGRTGRGMDGYFGNPFVIGTHGSRAEVIKRFREYAYQRLRTDREYRARVLALHGKTLVCFCAPEPCHGDILAEFASMLAAGWLRED